VVGGEKDIRPDSTYLYRSQKVSRQPYFPNSHDLTGTLSPLLGNESFPEPRLCLSDHFSIQTPPLRLCGGLYRSRASKSGSISVRSQSRPDLRVFVPTVWVAERTRLPCFIRSCFVVVWVRLSDQRRASSLAAIPFRPLLPRSLNNEVIGLVELPPFATRIIGTQCPQVITLHTVHDIACSSKYP
jgi:hypothetical protein